MTELFSILANHMSTIADIGLGASALYLASKLTMRVQDHERRIGVLERKAA